ncbi:aminopeptidase N-like [Anopheles darlingi]|uniref:aminopeptidase N-like n=1 Tax=Anopheles darlingi TaxID=43151 RepID=UPI002100009F|nr:aminopeptidase N-like [Anopheles darlingi]
MVIRCKVNRNQHYRWYAIVGLLLGFELGIAASVSPLRELVAWDTLSPIGGSTETVFAPAAEIDQSYFLPNNSIPTHYSISLETDIHQNVRTFRATTWVYLTILEPSDRITMHLQELTIMEARLYRVASSGGQAIEIDQPARIVNIALEHVTFRTAATLPTGNYALRIVYTGIMLNYQSGYLASQYRNEQDQWRYVGSTHFQATHARRLLPCYDEPALKATFDLQIRHHRDYKAIANMPRTSIEIDPTNREYLISVFETTPRMSTYLLAFAVTDFATRENGKHQVVARSNAINDADYALQVGATILERLEDYLGVPYYEYMPKLTSIAIPDRGTGAMENWGLVTYGEPVMLYNPTVNTYRNRKDVTTIIAHEYAHQWFGDLVSPLWWQYIWLNEGFATLFQYYATRLAVPGDEYWELFNGEVIQRAFQDDASETIHSMNQNAATPQEILALFDSIAYKKAGSVLNMFRNVLGESSWQEGLKQYLKDYELTVASDSTLSFYLQQAVEGNDILPQGVKVQDLLASWTNAPGFPVLTVNRLYRDGWMILSQNRFMNGKVLPVEHVWHIPYNYAYASSASFYDLSQYDWLAAPAAKIASTVPDNEWVVFNKQQTGYYRVNYDRRNWELLIEALHANHIAIHRLNRAQLIDDAFHLARADLLDMSVVLRLLRYLRNERDYAPWQAADQVLTFLYEQLHGTEHEHAFLIFMDELIEEVYATLSVDTVNPGETTLYKYLKQLITGWACRIGYKDCLQRSREALRKEYSTPSAGETAVPVHPDVRAVVYCHGLQEDTEPEFQAIYMRLMNSRNQAERTDLLKALGCSQNENSLRTLLATIVLSASPGTNFIYLSEERAQLLNAVTTGTTGVGIATFVDVYSDTVSLQTAISIAGAGAMESAVRNVAAQCNTPQEREQLETLLKAVTGYVSSATVNSARALATAKLDWFNSAEALIVAEFLESYNNI